MKKIVLYFSFLMVILAACQSPPTTADKLFNDADSLYIPKYAKGFKIGYFKGYKIVQINHPWSPGKPGDAFLLANDEKTFLDKKGMGLRRIHTPVDNWVAFSSTMVNYADKLGIKSTISGVAEPQYITDNYITDQVNSKVIRHIGMAMAPDVEVIMDLEPDMVMVSPFKDNNYAAIKESGIPLVTNCDYLETSPLGRAEWIVFVSAFFNEEQPARRLFRRIEESYQQVVASVSDIKHRKTLFTGHLYQGIWNTPAGNNFMGRLFKDAGASYIYEQTEGTGTLTLDFETVFSKALLADYWVLIVNHPGPFSYHQLRAMDDRYSDFEAFRQARVIYTNTAHSLFFEKGLLEPHLVLSDLVFAMYPEVLPGYQPKYFFLLTN